MVRARVVKTIEMIEIQSFFFFLKLFDERVFIVSDSAFLFYVLNARNRTKKRRRAGNCLSETVRGPDGFSFRSRPCAFSDFRAGLPFKQRRE